MSINQRSTIIFRTIFAIGLLSGVLPCIASAACSSDDVMNKGSEISDTLTPKVRSNPDAAMKMMEEMGDIIGTGSITDATCSKLDALALRARKL